MTATIPAKGRLVHFGLYSSVPSGWSRDATFQQSFIQGAASYGGTGGGTHTHITQPHTHIQDQHRHAITVGGGPGAPTINAGLARLGAVSVANSNHLHGNSTGKYTTAINQDATVILSGDAISEQPPLVTSVIIKPDDGNQEVPNDILIFADSDLSDANYLIADGTNGTRNLDNRFIFDFGFDVGFFAFGNLTHTHTEPSFPSSHNHIQNPHTHDDSNEGTSSNFGTRVKSGPSGPASQVGGHHLFSNIQTVTATNNTNIPLTTDATSNLPAYVQLLALQNKSGTTQPVKKGMVIIFTGNQDEVPSDWVFCNGSKGTPDTVNKQIYMTGVVGNIGNTGGSNLHTHTMPSHTHTQNSHGHTYTFGASGNTQGVQISGFGVSIPTSAHTHSTRSYANATATNQDATVIVNESDKRLKYLEVLFIKYQPPTVRVLGNAHILGKVAIL